MTNPDDEMKAISPDIVDDDEQRYEIHHLDFWGIGRRSDRISAIREDPMSIAQALDSAVALFQPIITEYVGATDNLILTSSARTLFNRIYSTHTRTEARIIHDQTREKGLRALAFEVDDDFKFRSTIGNKKLTPSDLKVIPQGLVEKTAEICEATGLTSRCFQRNESENFVIRGQRTDIVSKRWIMLEFSFAKQGKHSFRMNNR